MEFFFFLLSIIIVLDPGSLPPKQCSDPVCRGSSRDKLELYNYHMWGWCISHAISVAKQDGSTLDKHLQLREIYWNCLGEHLDSYSNVHTTWNQELL